MALRVVEEAKLTDVGRQREMNEDNLVAASPLFAVADGMGGAQAGEVASQIATEVVASPSDGEGTPEQRLTEMALEANRRIHVLSRSDESRRGMGTTLTAAVVEDDAVTVAHVGDSRAYRMRDGTLEQLTLDHSLVAELERSGQLSAEAAEHHPQRSIITRALGPEPHVEVDAHTHRGRSGDIYLLCSDGLTSMISNNEIASILRAAPSLEEAVQALVRAANQSGGKDNITVVLFRLEDVAAEGAPAAVADETIHQGVTADDVQTAVAEQERAAAVATRPAPPTRGAPRATHLPCTDPRATATPAARRPRRLLGVVAGLALVAAVAAGAVVGARQVWFVGTNDAGLVALYRGLPYELPFGLELYSERYASSVPARTIGEARRERLLDHEWRSRGDAEDLVRQLERGTLDLGDPAR